MYVNNIVLLYAKNCSGSNIDTYFIIIGPPCVCVIFYNNIDASPLKLFNLFITAYQVTQLIRITPDIFTTAQNLLLLP